MLDDDDIKKIFEIDDKGTITVGLEGPKLLDRETKAQYEIAGTVIDNAGVGKILHMTLLLYTFFTSRASMW